MKSVSIVSRSIPLHGPGGMEKATWLVAAGLAQTGWDVEVITTRLKSGAAPAEVDGVRIRPVASSAPARYSKQFFDGARSILDSAPKLKPVLSVSAAGFDYLRGKKRRPVALVCHGTSWDEIRSKLKSRTLKSLVGVVRQTTWLPRDIAAYRRAEKIITVNDPVTDQIRAFLPEPERDKVSTIYNGFRPSRSASRAGWASDEFVAITSGRLVKEKGIHLFLESVAKLSERDRPKKIFICGDGPELPRLKELSTNLQLQNVTFTGHVSDVQPYLVQARVLVLPSLRLEGLPMSVIEALAVGCTCVIPNSLSFPAVSQQGIVRFQSGDVADLGRALIEAKAQPLHAGLVSALSLDRMVAGYAEVLESLYAES